MRYPIFDNKGHAVPAKSSERREVELAVPLKELKTGSTLSREGLRRVTVVIIEDQNHPVL
jgi:hypothetical protein